MNEHTLVAWRALMDRGTKCIADERYRDAADCFSQALSLAMELDVPVILAFTIRLLSTARCKLGDLELAEEGFKEAAAICERLNNAKGLAEAWAGLANVAMAKELPQAALEWYERSIEIYPASSPPLRLGMLYSDLGQAYAALKLWTQAKTAFQKACNLCRRYQYPRGEAELLVLMGEVSYRQGEKDEAVNLIKQACRIFAQLAEGNLLADALQYLAFLYYDQDKIQEAFQCQQRAIVLWLKLGLDLEASEGSYFLSKIAQSLGTIEEAESGLQTSISLYPRQDLGLAFRYQSLAGLALACLDFGRAEECYRKAAALFAECGERDKLGEVYEALAFLAEIQGFEDEACEYHRKSIVEFDGRGHLAIEAMMSLAQLQEKRGRWLEALQHYWQALHLARKGQVETERIESSIQGVSRKLRRKSK